MTGKTGVHRTVNLPPEVDARLTGLLEETGLNRNQLFKLVAQTMKVADVEALQRRLQG